MLPGEGEDLQAVVLSVTDVQLVPTHSQLTCTVEQPSPEAVAKLQRLRIQGYDLIVYSVSPVSSSSYIAQ